MANRSRDAASDRIGGRPGESDADLGGRGTESVAERGIRVVAATLGAALLVRGLGRRSFRGIATALLGGWLFYRALDGSTMIERTLRSRTPEGRRTDDRTQTDGATEVSRSITIGRPAEELYEAWRDPEKFSQVVGHLAEVAPTDGDRFHWTVHGPRGRDLSWETRIVEAEPGEFLRWETPEDAPLPNQGTVRFRPAPGDRGTVVTLSVRFDPPGGRFGDVVLERLDVVPKALAGTALGRFKSLVESGEIQTLAGNPSARGRGDLL